MNELSGAAHIANTSCVLFFLNWFFFHLCCYLGAYIICEKQDSFQIINALVRSESSMRIWCLFFFSLPIGRMFSDIICGFSSTLYTIYIKRVQCTRTVMCLTDMK